MLSVPPPETTMCRTRHKEGSWPRSVLLPLSILALLPQRDQTASVSSPFKATPNTKLKKKTCFCFKFLRCQGLLSLFHSTLRFIEQNQWTDEATLSRFKLSSIQLWLESCVDSLKSAISPFSSCLLSTFLYPKHGQEYKYCVGLQ